MKQESMETVDELGHFSARRAGFWVSGSVRMRPRRQLNMQRCLLPGLTSSWWKRASFHKLSSHFCTRPVACLCTHEINRCNKNTFFLFTRKKNLKGFGGVIHRTLLYLGWWGKRSRTPKAAMCWTEDKIRVPGMGIFAWDSCGLEAEIKWAMVNLGLEVQTPKWEVQCWSRCLQLQDWQELSVSGSGHRTELPGTLLLCWGEEFGKGAFETAAGSEEGNWSSHRLEQGLKRPLGFTSWGLL